MSLDVGQIIGTDLSPNANILGNQIADKTLLLRNLSDDAFGIIDTATVTLTKGAGSSIATSIVNLPAGSPDEALVISSISGGTSGGTTLPLIVVNQSGTEAGRIDTLVNAQYLSGQIEFYIICPNNGGGGDSYNSSITYTIKYYVLQQSADQ